MALTRLTVAAPMLPKETHDCPALGGEVIIRGLPLSQRLALMDAAGGDRYLNAARMLHACVIDPDGEPLLSLEQWEAFGAMHFDEALRLARVAQRLSGLDREADEKN